MKRSKLGVLATVGFVAVATFTVCKATGANSVYQLDTGEQVNVWNVTFDTDGGKPEPEPNPVTVKDGESIGDGFPDLDPEKADWTFGGWYRDLEGEQFDPETRVTRSITLFAKWIGAAEEGHFNVTFNGAGGSPTTTVVPNVGDGGTVVPFPPDPARTGWTFAEWRTEANGGGTEFSASTTVDSTLALAASPGDIALYANWTAIPYTVQYDANGGTGGTADSTHSYEAATALTANGFSNDGFLFKGWDSADAGLTAVYEDGASLTTSDLFTDNVTATKTLYAVWEALPASSYTISFDTQGGSLVDDQTVATGATVAYPDEPVLADSYFDGWYGDSLCASPYDYGTAIHGDGTVYAKWLNEEDMIAKEFDDVANTYGVANATEWATAKAGINAGGADKNYVIKVTGSFSLTSANSATFTPSGIKVLIYAPENKAITLSKGDVCLLWVAANQTLILRNITLNGRGTTVKNNSTYGLVYIIGSAVMRPGTVITNHYSDSYHTVGGTGALTMSGGANRNNTSYAAISVASFTMSGGAISVNTNLYGSVNSTSFTMSGGTISGNTSNYGGAVDNYDATFTMSGGTISGNKATKFGGGVYMCSTNKDVIFTMSGGTISNNEAPSGGGVYIDYYNHNGTFIMSGGIIYGSGAGAGLANTGTGAAIWKHASGIAKYGDDSPIIPSGKVCNDTLVGHN
jgi:uncharacterized repeat protein (TIGR02543 family)